MLIIRDAFRGKRRFGEFQKSLGMAKNILTARLKDLVEHGIFELEPASDGSAYQEYVLTARGRSLAPVLESLGNWGRENCPVEPPKKLKKTVRAETARRSP